MKLTLYGRADVTGPQAQPAPTATQEFTTSFKNWATVMSFLMVQYLDLRSRAGRLSIIFMLAEPVALILLFYLIRGVFRMAIAHYGDSLFLFLATGMFPFYLFLRTSLIVRRGQARSSPRLPRITSMDTFMAATAMNALIWLLAIVIVFAGMWAYGLEHAIPESIPDCGMALFLLIMAGIGFGLINSSIARVIPVWMNLARYTTRGLIFFSGVIQIADFYRLPLRDWLAWNPILQGVTWFRYGVYGRYPDLLLDPAYLAKCTLVLIFVGLVADRATLRIRGR